MEFAYERLDVWRLAMDWSEGIYKVTRSFPAQEQFGLTAQIRRASVSVPANIAEGKGRDHKKAFIHFLYIARASLYETTTLLRLGLKLEYLGRTDYQELVEQASRIMSKLSGLVRSLQ